MRAALRSRIRARQLASLLKPRPARLICLIDVFAVSVLAFVAPVMMRIWMASHHALIVSNSRLVSGMPATITARPRRIFAA